MFRRSSETVFRARAGEGVCWMEMQAGTPQWPCCCTRCNRVNERIDRVQLILVPRQSIDIGSGSQAVRLFAADGPGDRHSQQVPGRKAQQDWGAVLTDEIRPVMLTRIPGWLCLPDAHACCGRKRLFGLPQITVYYVASHMRCAEQHFLSCVHRRRPRTRGGSIDRSIDCFLRAWEC